MYAAQMINDERKELLCELWVGAPEQEQQGFDQTAVQMR